MRIDPSIDRALQEQSVYYEERAGEYDEWFQRLGRYDGGEAFNRRWVDAVAEFHAALVAMEAHTVLEIGCGTGFTTQVLASGRRDVVAVDASPRMLEVCARRVGYPVKLVEADLYSFEPGQVFEAVVFTFVLSHVPRDLFEPFWSRVGDWLAPGGTVFLADSLYAPSSTAADHELRGPESQTVRRRLNDGREFEIVKVFHEPEGLTEELSSMGWTADLHVAGDFFYYGTVRRT